MALKLLQLFLILTSLDDLTPSAKHLCDFIIRARLFSSLSELLYNLACGFILCLKIIKNIHVLCSRLI